MLKIVMPRQGFIVVLGMVMVLLAGCAQSSGPGQVVEAYYQALAAKDQAKLVNAICPDWEANAMLEFDSFGAVDAKLDGVTCSESGTDGDVSLVTCQGSIAVTYRGEDTRPLSLEGNIYRVISIDGEWRVCGYS